MRVRKIDVQEGDAFDMGAGRSFVVETIDDGWKAFGRAIEHSGHGARATSVLVSRLQADYKRLGTKATERAHKQLAKIDAKRAAKVRR